MIIRENETYINKNEISKNYGLSKNFTRCLINLQRFDAFTVFNRNVKYVNKNEFEKYLIENGLWGDLSEYVQFIRDCV